MNHFLDETKQSDAEKLRELVDKNPLKDVRPSYFKSHDAKQAQANAKQRAGANDTQQRFEESLKNELGSLEEANNPGIKG